MKSDKIQRGPKGFILLEPGNIMQILPEDNMSWLTLFYSLPEELVSKRPAYMNLPRCPFDVIRRDDYAELLNTDVFLELVWDCYAWSAWQYFEVPNKDGDYRQIPGSFNSYSGDFPLWRLSYGNNGKLHRIVKRTLLSLELTETLQEGLRTQGEE